MFIHSFSRTRNSTQTDEWNLLEQTGSDHSPFWLCFTCKKVLSLGYSQPILGAFRTCSDTTSKTSPTLELKSAASHSTRVIKLLCNQRHLRATSFSVQCSKDSFITQSWLKSNPSNGLGFRFHFRFSPLESR